MFDHAYLSLSVVVLSTLPLFPLPLPHVPYLFLGFPLALYLIPLLEFLLALYLVPLLEFLFALYPVCYQHLLAVKNNLQPDHLHPKSYHPVAASLERWGLTLFVTFC